MGLGLRSNSAPILPTYPMGLNSQPLVSPGTPVLSEAKASRGAMPWQCLALLLITTQGSAGWAVQLLRPEASAMVRTGY